MLATVWRPTKERQADNMCTDKGFIVSAVNRGKPKIQQNRLFNHLFINLFTGFKFADDD